jgi:hypothetical protein
VVTSQSSYSVFDKNLKSISLLDLIKAYFRVHRKNRVKEMVVVILQEVL